MKFIAGMCDRFASAELQADEDVLRVAAASDGPAMIYAAAGEGQGENVRCLQLLHAFDLPQLRRTRRPACCRGAAELCGWGAWSTLRF